MKNFDERVVIVLDTSNYISEYSERAPFKAIVQQVYENEIWVKSLVSDKEYQLYYSQILETLDIEEIKFLLEGGEYGMYDWKLFKDKL